MDVVDRTEFLEGLLLRHLWQLVLYKPDVYASPDDTREADISPGDGEFDETSDEVVLNGQVVDRDGQLHGGESVDECSDGDL